MGERPAAPAPDAFPARSDVRDTVTAWFVRRLDPHFQIGSLLSFNAKFHPRWVPRYLVYRAAGDFAPVGLAAASAEGFVPLERRPVAAS